MCVGGEGGGVFGRGAVIIWWWEEGASGQGSGGLRGAKDECDGLGGWGGGLVCGAAGEGCGGGGGGGISGEWCQLQRQQGKPTS